MGLDMYLEGERFLHSSATSDPGTNPRPEEEGYRVSKVTVEMAYWRKHYALDRYISTKYGEGEEGHGSTRKGSPT